MAYNILYIEDQAAESRAQDMSNLGFTVETFDPSSDIKEVLQKITQETSALVLDYRLTAGEKRACFDAPTVAQTLRSKHSHDSQERSAKPIVLMSNESVITDYYNDFTSQDLFDFILTKKEFIDNQARFGAKLKAFIKGYATIVECEFNIVRILGLQANQEELVHSSILIKTKRFDKNIFEYSQLAFEQIIRSIGPLIGSDVLSARLGVSKDSADWNVLLHEIRNAKYVGILSDIYDRWWMSKINDWWKSAVAPDLPLRRLDAEERVELLKAKFNLDLAPAIKTKYSRSTNFWTICIDSNEPIDPFDGVELLKRDILPWQEKEYLSIDSTMTRIDKYKDFISAIDKKAMRELSQKINADE